MGLLQRRDRVQHAHGQRLLAAAALRHPELDPLAGLEHRAGWQGRGVDIDVPTVVAGEEAEALLRVEPLDLAAGHREPRCLPKDVTHPGYPARHPPSRDFSARIPAAAYAEVADRARELHDARDDLERGPGSAALRRPGSPDGTAVA